MIAVFRYIPNPFDNPWLSTWIRWNLGSEAVRILFATRGLGAGIGSFTHVINPAGPREILAPHNWLFYLLAEFGVVGTGLFLLGYSYTLYDLGSSYLRRQKVLKLASFGTLVALPIGALGPSNAVLMQSFWLFLGLGLAATYRI